MSGIRPLSELVEYHVVHPNQDCRGWDVVDESGRLLGRVAELMVDLDRERVCALRMADGVSVDVENVSLLDGSVVVDDVVGLPGGLRPSGDGFVDLRDRRPTHVPIAPIPEGRTFTSFEDELRRHHVMHLADAGPFDEFLDAYRHGFYLGRGYHYRGRTWEMAADEVRQDWEARYPDTPWEAVRSAVQGAWDLVRGAG